VWNSKWDRWGMYHSRTDFPVPETLCTTHWTKFGALGMAMQMNKTSKQMGFHHIYYVKRLPTYVTST
jgi:hypothetical protein